MVDLMPLKSTTQHQWKQTLSDAFRMMDFAAEPRSGIDAPVWAGGNVTDRELLELAAKAADYQWKEAPERPESNPGLWLVNPIYTCWNPLEDDAAALRLAVLLGIEITHGAVRSYPRTRRMIVQKAAEMGKGKRPGSGKGGRVKQINEKPRLRAIRMGVFAGDELLWEYDRFELRPGPNSPFTLDQTFIGASPEGVYKAWQRQVDEWKGKIDAPPIAGD